MKILLKTKQDLLNEGWIENKLGALTNDDYSADVGYFSYWFTNLLGTELIVIDYLMDFYIAEPQFMINGLYIPKCIVKEEIIESFEPLSGNA